MFRNEGDFRVRVENAFLSEAKFEDSDFDVVVAVATEDGQRDEWRGKWGNYPGPGTASDRTQSQLTMETLRKLGLQGEDIQPYLQWGQDGAAVIPALIGAETMATVKASTSKTSGKVYYNVAYLGGNASKPLSFEKFQRFFGQQQQPPPPQQYQQPQGYQAPPPPPQQYQQAPPQQYQQPPPPAPQFQAPPPPPPPQGYPQQQQAAPGQATTNPF